MPGSITIVGIGTKRDMLDPDVERYIKLLKPYAQVTISLIKTTQAQSANAAVMLKKEEDLLCSHWPKRSYPVGLSEEGSLFSSHAFSQWISRRLQDGSGLVFTIGGAYGLSAGIKKRCSELISLSPLTFPHRLCYMVLIEQLYRAFTILKGHPYHK